MEVTLTEQGLQIDGQFVPVYSGTVHYWRLERTLWPKILDQAIALGFRMIETYIPWSIHETSPGHYDWGQEDDRKDVEAFMALCEARGLWLIVRPGPLINAELTDFGFPEWVLIDPEVQARTNVDGVHLDAAWGLHPPHQFPVPSYASETFYRYVAGWFDAICPIMARHLAPKGCIVTVQSDNETCYLFHDQTYATDYSTASIQLYQNMLREQYGSIDAVNTAYNRQYRDFDDIQPPRDYEVETKADLPWHLDWTIYKEYQIIYSVARFARMLRERGITEVPIFQDVAFQYKTPLDIITMEAHPDIDWVGMNLYRNKEAGRGSIQQIRYMAGATHMPFIPELGCGIWYHYPLAQQPDEQEFITLLTLMYGLKAFNLYMLVERDRWLGSPITRHGKFRPEYADFYRRLTAFLDQHRFWEFKRQPKVAVLLNYDLGRYAALTSTLHYAHVDLLGLPRQLFAVEPELGLRWDAHAEADFANPTSWLNTLYAELAARHIDYNLADTHLDAQRLADYDLICAQSIDFLAAEAQERLLTFVQNGGHLVIGPGLPYLDATLNPCSVFGDYLDKPGTTAIGKGNLTWVETREINRILSEYAPAPEYDCDSSDVQITFHQTDGCDLLFLANFSADAIDTKLSFDGRRRFKQIWGGTQTFVSDGTLPIHLSAYRVHIFEVSHAD